MTKNQLIAFCGIIGSMLTGIAFALWYVWAKRRFPTKEQIKNKQG
jgi:ABC-type transport system involved in cytochrome c biogenesis permease subunit